MDSIAPNFETAMLVDNLIHLPYVRTTSPFTKSEPSVAWIGDGMIPCFKSEDFGFARIFGAGNRFLRLFSCGWR